MKTLNFLNKHSSDARIFSIDEQKYATKKQIEDAKALVARLDFMDQDAHLINFCSWKSDKVMVIESLYKEWLILHKVYGHSITMAPSKALDEYWHQHITLDTRKYMEDCNIVFGYYLHHYPYFGLTEKETKADLEQGFALTQKLFQKHFGHGITGIANPCRATSCR